MCKYESQPARQNQVRPFASFKNPLAEYLGRCKILSFNYVANQARVFRTFDACDTATGRDNGEDIRI